MRKSLWEFLLGCRVHYTLVQSKGRVSNRDCYFVKSPAKQSSCSNILSVDVSKLRSWSVFQSANPQRIDVSSKFEQDQCLLEHHRTNLLKNKCQELGAQVIERPCGLLLLLMLLSILLRVVGRLASARGQRRHSLSPLIGTFHHFYRQLTNYWRHG